MLSQGTVVYFPDCGLIFSSPATQTLRFTDLVSLFMELLGWVGDNLVLQPLIFWKVSMSKV
jgi:hypothetical protein